MANNKAKTACESVRVVVRCRPPNNMEATAENGGSVLDVDAELGRISVRNPSAPSGELAKEFTFHSVFGWGSTQGEVYDDAVRPLVDSVLTGFNGTVFAYGQTGTGKTWTMRGLPGDPEKRGVIPNAFHHIFTHICRSRGHKYLVRSSYLEIYQEEIRDLLLESSRKLELKESPEEGVYVKDLSWVVTKDSAEMHHLLAAGDRSRSVGSTDANSRSSRSHAVFAVTVECQSESEDPVRVGRLNMVDLAGSERQSRTGARGERLREAAKINLSLSALGNVISALADRKGGHVPYRDSKLTRLLQDSLGGNAKTVMIATVGPSERDRHESLATLRYASRAKNIKNKPRVNEDPEAALLRDFQREIARLKALLEERGASARERRQKRRDGKRLSRDLAQLCEEDEPKEAGGQWDREAVEKIIEKYKAMESKLLEGGKTITDHTNEQQKLLERKRLEIAEQIRREREMRRQITLRDEETLEMRETFSSLQQEVEMKTKKLRKLYTKLQLVWAEMRDAIDEHVASRQELEQTQNQLTRELKYKTLLMENFVPPAEKKKILNRLDFDADEEQWRLLSAVPSESAPKRVKRRPLSAVGYKRPISQHAQSAVATATGDQSRYQAENIMLLQLDVSPAAMLALDLHGARPGSGALRDAGPSARRLRKSASWYQTPRAACVSASASSGAVTSPSQSRRHGPRPSSVADLPPAASLGSDP
ncbi:kinesin-like protein KIF3B [Syngnathoides biaculeatus]|uniref:kinesin-like protein KIF3B n=1 Tax=Syngnathoides biaculeatus TaxID=300417 RepID=UPI002ADDCE8B|nr:kinesin-like protein KIF3B [Syngnathoides biaculeatus]